MIYNTGETNEELKVCYNPEGSILRKAQLRMLDMLLYIDKICKEQNIEYCLDSGNVLGAIRHGGFIPWDDDVDIILDRKNYKKLCNYLYSHPHPQYILQMPETDSFFTNHWNVLRDINSEYIQDSKIHNLRKFRGMQIDIFPIENNVSPLLHRMIYSFHCRITDKTLVKFPSLGVFFYRLERFFIIPIVRCISRFIFKNKRNIFSYAYGLPWQKEFDGNILFPVKNIEFEGYFFPSPNKVHEYLEIQYGDYMKLPSKENRNHHRATYRIYE